MLVALVIWPILAGLDLARIGEARQPQRAPQRHQAVPARPAHQRRDRKRDEQKDQSEDAGGSEKELDRIRAERAAGGVKCQIRERNKRVQRDQKFIEPYVRHQKYFFRSMPAYIDATWSP